MTWRSGLMAWAAIALSCSGGDEAPLRPLQRVQLPAALAAKVDLDEISLQSVARIARAQHVSPEIARERAINDALFAAGARAAFARDSVLSVLERAAFARAILERFKTEAIARGPATDAEVAELTALRWQELDRPETVRTTHAVAQSSTPALDARAKAVAQRIWEAVRGVQDPQEFIRLAQAVPHEGVEVRAESLPAVTRDGRVYYAENAPADAANQRFDAAFAEAASKLSLGQISEPVKSPFGYHVIWCEARIPGKTLPLEERRALLADEVIKGRAEREKRELLTRLSSAAPILITRSIDELTASVRIAE